jgi:arabinan endo-1,5-alpha-L-arabinosidase
MKKHVVKYFVVVMLMCAALASSSTFYPHKAQAATAATLDTVYQYKMVNEKSALVLGISSPQLTAGSAAIQERDERTAGHQREHSLTDQWHFMPAGGGDYKILNTGSGEVLGVSAASTSAGASVLQWADNGTNDHLWEFISQGNNLYEILNVNSGLALDVAGAATAPGANIVQETYTGTADQLWQLVSTGRPVYSNPDHATGDVTVHDPSMIRTRGGLYYAFSTTLATPHNGIEMRASRDLIHWSDVGTAFSTLPAWINAYNGGNGEMWAPDVSYHHGTYWLYYAVSTFGSEVSAIGLATSSTATPGSWIDQGLVFASQAAPPWYNAIDPGLVVSPDGTMWLSFGSWWTGIYMIQIDPATGKQLATNTTVYHLAERLDISKGIEGAYIYRHGGYYYLFVSLDNCCSASATYHIAVGRSTSPTGPYVDEGGVNMLSGGGTIILSTHGNIVGPGGQSVLADGPRSLLVYHYYDANNNGSPTLGLNWLVWSPEGWPYVV